MMNPLAILPFFAIFARMAKHPDNDLPDPTPSQIEADLRAAGLKKAPLHDAANLAHHRDRIAELTRELRIVTARSDGSSPAQLAAIADLRRELESHRRSLADLRSLRPARN